MEHSLTGTGIVGSFLSGSLLYLDHCNITNNSLNFDSSVDFTQQAVMSLFTSFLIADTLNFADITLYNGAKLMFTIKTWLNTTNINVKNVTVQAQDNCALMEFFFCSVFMTEWEYTDSGSLFLMDNSWAEIANFVITNIEIVNGNQFIVQSIDSTINIDGLIYTERNPAGTLTSIIQGSRALLWINASRFVNVTSEANTVITLEQSSSIFLYQTSFEYSENSKALSVLDLTKSIFVIIDSCTFSFAGQILKAQTANRIIFTSNAVITSPFTQSILLQNVDYVSVVNNNLIGGYGITNINTNTLDNFASSQVGIIDASKSAFISKNSFISLYGQSGILSLQSQNNPYNATISNNVFINNHGFLGGSIYLSVNKKWSDGVGTPIYPHVIIQKSIFLQNKAISSDKIGTGSGKGGAIYQTSLLHTHQDTALTGNTFINNTAQSNGGAIFFDFSPLLIDSTNTFQGNYATQPNHIASYPVRVSPFSASQPPNITYIPSHTPPAQPSHLISHWSNVPSGLEDEQQYVFALFDMYNQVVFDDSSSTLQLYPNGFSSDDRHLFSSLTSVTAKSGLYYYHDFIFNFKANEKMNVSFYSDAVKNPDSESIEGQYPAVSSALIEVSFRGCIFGEYLISSGQFTKCQECQVGYWSVGRNGFDSKQACTECDHTSTICLGGSRIGPNPGYWRMNETSDIVTACANPKACLGNNPNVNYYSRKIDPVGKCAPRFKGNMCDRCVHSYGKISNSECVDCRSSVLQYVELSFILLFQIIILILGVKEVVDMTAKLIDNKGEASIETNGAILVRILVNYLQMIALIEEVPIAWPSALKNALSISAKLSFAKGLAISTDCFLQLGRKITNIREVFLSTSLTVLTPLVFILLSVLFWIIYFKLRGREVIRNKNFSNQAIATIVIICFNLQPNIIKSCFELFRCINLYRTDTPVNFLTSDYDLQCWTSEHMLWINLLSIPALIVWGLGLPVFVFYILRKNITNLESIDFKKKYSFLYVGYKQERCYWELFILIRKLLLICIIVFAGFRSKNLQMYLSVVLVTLSYLAQKQNQPFSNESLNNLENVSLISAGLINFCGLYFEIARGVPGLDFIIMSVGLFGNFYFIIKFTRIFLALKIEAIKNNPKLMIIVEFVAAKCCCCLRTRGFQKAVESVQRCLRSGLNAINRLFDIIMGTNKLRQIRPEPIKGPIAVPDSAVISMSSFIDVGAPLAASSLLSTPVYERVNNKASTFKRSNNLGRGLRGLGSIHADETPGLIDNYSEDTRRSYRLKSQIYQRIKNNTHGDQTPKEIKE